MHSVDDNALHREASSQAFPLDPALEWKISAPLVPYPKALHFMEKRVEDIQNHHAAELIWLLEHPPLYTAGTSAKESDLITQRFPVYDAGRGGQYTYHGPGQRVAYVMLDLRCRGQDVRAYVHNLESWVILALQKLGINAVRREGRVGLWVPRKNGLADDKIAAIGVRIRKWITFHGVSINVNPDLSHYTGIIPCGIKEHGVTSLEALGCAASLHDLDLALQEAWGTVFPPIKAP